MTKKIDGETFRQMIIAGARAIEAHKHAANELNVFPVPDGDTGTNMSMTMKAASHEMEKLKNPLVGKAAETAASSLLRGARGNSGVILSLLFRGMAKVLKGASYCDGKMLADAAAEGVATAYKAVMKPAEGTILTVSRVSAEKAKEAAEAGGDAEAVLSALLARAKTALLETTGQNPVLQKANVVDAGAFGMIVIWEGMYAALTGGEIPEVYSELDDSSPDYENAFAAFHTEDIEFTYCTEFIAERKDRRRSVNKLRTFMQNMGDSAVVVDDGEIIKVHVHSNNPDRILAEGLKFGPLVSVKVENMRMQHTLNVLTGEELSEKRGACVPERKYGFVAVAAGDGIAAAFRDMGVDQIVSGGQTMNPSTEDILAAVEQTPSEVVFVFPNNKNIIMAAEQAARLCGDRRMVVIPSVTIPQGITALLNYNENAEEQENIEAMTGALKLVHTGQLTYAVRDSYFDGRKIKAGDYIALAENKLYAHGKKENAMIKKLAGALIKKETTFITVFYGADVTEEQAKEAAAILQAEAKNAEINVINGGQEIYYYIISAE